MGVGVGKCVVIHDASAVSEARRTAVDLARSVGFDDSRASDVAIVVSEVASNIHKHAGGGCLVLQTVEFAQGVAIEVLGLDCGPGIGDLKRSRRDGFSTSGTAGTGLGAIARIAALSDVYSVPGHGTAVLARVAKRNGGGAHNGRRMEVSAVCLPISGEDACGDNWFMRNTGRGSMLAVCDGLGHGLPAADASAAAGRVFVDNPTLTPTALLEKMHESMRGTRGGAVAIADIDLDRRMVDFAGVGNVVALLLSDAGVRHCVSHNGIVGGDRPPRIQPFTYPFGADPMLIMHSDGLSTHWDLSTYAGLTARDPSLVAGVLYRDFKRDRDDVTVVVAKGRQP